MKKDDKLERAFDEYFEGAELPEGLAEDAKKLNTKRKPLWTRLAKYASALACALVVCIVAAVGIYSGVNYLADEQSGGASGNASGGSSGNYGSEDDGSASGGSSDGSLDNSGSSDGGTEVLYDETYSLSGLETVPLDANTISEKDSALSIIETFAYASNASVTNCTGYYSESGLMLVEADITVAAEYNQQTTIYVEFTDDGYTCEDLTYYYDGESHAYGNISYIYYETEDNGEPVRCVTAAVNGVKYYIRVTSADTDAYLDYLALLENL